jgi:outer membrane protein, heavy metal efflux system
LLGEVRAAEGRKKQAGLYPNPTAGYLGEQIRGGSFRGGEQGFFVQQEIVLGGKLGLGRNVFEQERQQTLAEAQEQRLRVLNNVRILFYQALGEQKRLELRQNLSRLADDAVETSKQLFNVGQADEPDLLQAEVEAEQSKLAVTIAEESQLRTWHSLAATLGKPDLPLTQLEGNLEETPAVSDGWLQALLRDSPAVKIAELGVTRSEASLSRAGGSPFPICCCAADCSKTGSFWRPQAVLLGCRGLLKLVCRSRCSIAIKGTLLPLAPRLTVHVRKCNESSSCYANALHLSFKAT